MSGPSGVGKGTVLRLVREEIPELRLTVSATTREPRPGDVADVSYHFMSDEEFEIKLEQVASNIGITSVSDILKEDAEAYREKVDKRKVLDFLKSKTTVVSPASEEGATGATVAPAQAE